MSSCRPLFLSRPTGPTIIRLTCLGWLVAFVGLTFVSGAEARAASDEDDFVRFTLEPPGPSPYHTIRYEITRRGPATTAVHRRGLPGLDEGLHALGLMTREEGERIFALAREVDAVKLTDHRPKHVAPGAVTWRCHVQLSGVSHTFLVTDPDNAERRYARLFSAVRHAALTIAGELPFRNVFVPATDRGWLNIESVPAARVRIDGFDTRLETPMYSYELAAGPHTITLTSLDGRYSRTFEIRLEPQGTTTLRVDLR